jgi:CDP-paratose synthetase
VRILVTGATGFIGSNLLAKLTGYDVGIVVRNIIESMDKDKQIVIDDDLQKFRNAVKSFDPEIVFHLATYSNSNDDISSIKNIIDSNILFTSIMLDSLKDTHVKLFVNTGTFAEYYFNDEILNPAYYYAASKTAVRYIIKYFKNIIGFNTINVIPYTVYGGRSRTKKVIDYIIDSLDSNVPIEMTNGEQILDFVHVDDIADFFIYCIRKINDLMDGMDYHIGTGIGTSIRELAATIEAKTGKKAYIQWGARQYRRSDIMKAIAPLENIKGLDWTPKISLEEGLTRLILEKTS